MGGQGLVKTKITYNGVELTKFFEVTNISRDIGTESESNLITNRFMGSFFIDSHNKEKIITVEFVIPLKKELKMIKRELARLLNVTEPKPLIFSDEPDIYYNAIKDGSINLNEEKDGKSYGEITFLVPEGYGLSVEEKVFSSTYHGDTSTTFIEPSMFTNNVVFAQMPYTGSPSLETLKGYTLEFYEPKNIYYKDGVDHVFNTYKDGTTPHFYMSWDILQAIDEVVEPSFWGDNASLTGKLSMAKSKIKSFEVTSYQRGSRLGAYSTFQIYANGWSGTKSGQTPQNGMNKLTFTDSDIPNNTWLHSDGRLHCLCSGQPKSAGTNEAIKVDNIYLKLELAHENKDLMIPVENMGTVASEPNFEITFNSECGFVGIVNDNKIIQYGNPEEVTVEIVPDEKLIHDDMEEKDAGNWKQNQGYIRKDPHRNKKDGTMSFKKGLTYAYPSWHGVYNNLWHGPSIYRELPSDAQGFNTAKNWTARTYVTFDSAEVRQTGIVEMNLTDASGKMIASLCLTKGNVNDTDIYIEYWAGDIMYRKHKIPKQQKLTAWIEIEKFDDKVTFNVSTLNHKNTIVVNDASIVNSEVKGITLWAAQFGKIPVKTVKLYEFQFIKHNTGNVEEVKNVFNAGDTLLIKTSEAKAYLNGKKAMNPLAYGSEMIKLPPGNQKVWIAYSNWATPPDVRIFNRERWY